MHMMAERLVPRAYADAQVVMRKGTTRTTWLSSPARRRYTLRTRPTWCRAATCSAVRSASWSAARRAPVNRLGANEYFGEGAMIGEDGGVRNACVIASGPLDVYLLTREALRACAGDPHDLPVELTASRGGNSRRLTALAPRRRERAKNGGKMGEIWGRNGRETAVAEPPPLHSAG